MRDSGPSVTSRETSASGSPVVSGAAYTKQITQLGQRRRNWKMRDLRSGAGTECPMTAASTCRWAARDGPSSGLLGEITENPATARTSFLDSSKRTFRLIESTRYIKSELYRGYERNAPGPLGQAVYLLVSGAG